MNVSRTLHSGVILTMPVEKFRSTGFVLRTNINGKKKNAWIVRWRAGVPDRKFVKKLYFSRRSLDFQSFWYLSLGMPIFVIIRNIMILSNISHVIRWASSQARKNGIEGRNTPQAHNISYWRYMRNDSSDCQRNNIQRHLMLRNTHE